MPEKSYDQFDAAVEVDDEDLLVIMQAGHNLRCTAGQIRSVPAVPPTPAPSFQVFSVEAIPARTFALGQSDELPGATLAFTAPIAGTAVVLAKVEFDQVWHSGFVSQDFQPICFVRVNTAAFGLVDYGLVVPFVHAAAPAGNALNYGQGEVCKAVGFATVPIPKGLVTMTLCCSVAIVVHDSGFNRVQGDSRMVVVVPVPVELVTDSAPRSTEEGDGRITEEGEERITE